MYKTIWFKIHAYLGLFFGIILLIVGVSGALLSYEKEIVKAINPKSFTVAVPNSYQKPQAHEILQFFKQNNPTMVIQSITLFEEASASAVINVASSNPKQKRGVNYYINPYTHEMLPTLQGQHFFKVTQDLHRRLMMGDFGKQLVGFSTAMLLVLSLSGLYLYYPKMKKAFAKSLTFSFKSKGRSFLSALHSSIGLWVLPLYILAVLTGLYWSYEWYREGLYTIFDTNKPARHINATQSVNNSQIAYMNTTKAFELFEKQNLAYESATIILPKKQNMIYTINYFDKNKAHSRARNQMQIDIQQGVILQHQRYENKAFNEKIMASMLPLHSGEFFGKTVMFLMFFASLLMPLFVITGLILYIKRHRKY
jgi:sulfite reductase (NADPH) flavoprotein alpha-component